MTFNVFLVFVQDAGAVFISGIVSALCKVVAESAMYLLVEPSAVLEGRGRVQSFALRNLIFYHI